MISGIGIAELFLISFVFLIFFNSKDLPAILKHLGKVINAFKNFMTPIQAELSNLSSDINTKIDYSTKQSPTPSKIEQAIKTESIRGKQSSEKRDENTDKIAKKLFKLSDFKNANSVMIYELFSEEVYTSPQITCELKDLSKKIIVPYCNFVSKTLGISHVENPDLLEENRIGIKEPIDKIRDNYDPEDIDLILVPGIRFDAKGYRIGGYGYYNNFIRKLKSNIPIIGLAFEYQVTSSPILTSEKTLPLDILITEERIIYRNRTFNQKENSTC